MVAPGNRLGLKLMFLLTKYTYLHTWLNALWRKDYFVIVENNLSILFGNYVKCTYQA